MVWYQTSIEFRVTQFEFQAITRFVMFFLSICLGENRLKHIEITSMNGYQLGRRYGSVWTFLQHQYSNPLFIYFLGWGVEETYRNHFNEREKSPKMILLSKK